MFRKSAITVNNVSYLKYDIVAECTFPFFRLLEFDGNTEYFSEMKHKVYAYGFYAVVLFQEGKGSFFVDGTEYEVKPGRIFFLNDKRLHVVRNLKGKRGIAMYFSPDLLNLINSSRAAHIKCDIFDNPVLNYCDLPEESDSRLLGVMDMLTDKRNGVICHDVSISTLLISLFVSYAEQFCKWNQRIENDVNRKSYKIYVRFKKMVDQHYLEKREVKDYLPLLGVSSRKLSQSTKEYEYGHTPLKIITEKFIKEAMKLLLEVRENSVTETAFALRFNDVSNFIKFFKRYAGLTPAEYRKNHLLQKQDK